MLGGSTADWPSFTRVAPIGSGRHLNFPQTSSDWPKWFENLRSDVDTRFLWDWRDSPTATRERAVGGETLVLCLVLYGRSVGQPVGRGFVVVVFVVFVVIVAVVPTNSHKTGVSNRYD